MARNSQIVVSTPAPVGGLNVRDAINDMPKGDAIELKNWIAQQYGVRSRKGYSEWAIGLPSACESILTYQSDFDVVSSYKMFGVTDGGIYDVTSTTNAPVLSLALSGASGAGRCNSAGFTNSAGRYLAMCSFEGGYYLFDGSTWSKKIFGTGAGQISGLDPDDFCFVTSWKRKLWFVEKDSTSAWYLPTDQITGEAREFDLGPFVKNGGKLSFITNWTIDAGEGIDDLIAFVFEGGDVLIYKGVDPNSATSFALVGAYNVGAIPTGRRGFVPYGADVLILSEFGIQPLSYVTRGGQTTLSTNAAKYLEKVQPRISDLVGGYSRENGWELVVQSRDNLLLVVLPLAVSNTYQQYAMYSNTNTWSLFEGMPIRCTAVSDSGFWFGTADGKVCKGFSGYFDAVPWGASVGNGITGTIRPSFSYFGGPGKNKQFLMARPTFMAVDRPGVIVGMTTDYKSPPAGGAPVGSTGANAVWDTAQWDAAQWKGLLNTYSDWASLEALGYTGSAYIITNVVGDTFLVSIDYIFEYGGPM